MRNKREYFQSDRTPPGPEEMSVILERCGISFSSLQIRQLWKYHQLLREFNPELNLTRIHNFENMVLKLYVDSILPLKLMDLPSPLMDLGTGPGMPGIPIRIAAPHLELLLAESRQKRISFLRKAVDQLQLEGVEIIGRSITSESEYPVSGIITRAVESIGVTLQRIGGSLDTGGLAIFMKGPGCDGEIREACDLLPNEYRLVNDIDYRIPGTPNERRLVVFERISQPLRVRKGQAMKRHTARRIESEHNEIYTELKKLLVSRGIRKQGRALVSGQRPTSEILRDYPDLCLAWISLGDSNPPPEDTPSHTDWYQLAPGLFKTLDVFGTASPLLLIKVREMDPWVPSQGFPEGCSILIPFQDPENVGAVLRSAAAFGAAQAILLAESAHPYHPKALRASGGAALKIRLLEGPSIEELPEDLNVLPLSTGGRDISTIDFPGAFGFLPGVEGPGLPRKWREKAVSIPILKEVESLNAAAAAAIALYAWSRSLRGGREATERDSALPKQDFV